MTLLEKIFQRNLKNPLTSPKKYGIIKSQKDKDSPKNQKGIDTMANKNGLTIKAGFERAREVFAEMGDAEMVAFFDKRLEQNAKKSASSGERKLTPHQLENEKIKEGIVDNMTVGTIYSIADMLCTFDCFPETMTPNRLAALLSQLGSRGSQQIVRIEEKGKAFYRLAENGDYAE